ncbi:MAG: ATP-binding cassette domain-containing protein [Candidatus Gastranaerophilales bacterium]|jgi:cobalt/nickel transport system ATP-binding protein|nr:ATP-binding cassette domain-containing protein [Candidatus Gastranaerophilales bacterium]
MEKIVEINCLEHIYPDKTRIELCGIAITIRKGEKVAVLGPSGSGKTTMLKHITGLLSPSSGVIKVFGADPAREYNKIRGKIGVVLQNVEEQLIGPTVIEDVMFSPLNYGYSPQKAREMAENILNELGISHLKDKIIHYLSGGEKRKVALAGALVMSPELLVLDEPFSGLDMKSQHTYVRLIDDYSRQKGISVILSTHDIELTVDFADTIYLISSQNKLFLKGSPKELFCQPKELEKFNLEPPAILDLFVRLKEKNVNTEIPTTVDEAVDLLLAKLNVQ